LCAIMARDALREPGKEINMAKNYDYNVGVIEDFRSNAGKPTGRFEGRPILLLTMTGAKSGKQRTTPLMYLEDGDRCVVFASKGGGPTNPDWYHNVVANPTVTLEVGAEKFQAKAALATGKERDALFARQVAAFPIFGEYEQKAPRTIPVVVFTRA
jgi:deazaflavin-dependent oxidoreductase (nitroreductase family)